RPRNNRGIAGHPPRIVQTGHIFPRTFHSHGFSMLFPRTRFNHNHELSTLTDISCFFHDHDLSPGTDFPCPSLFHVHAVNQPCPYSWIAENVRDTVESFPMSCPANGCRTTRVNP